MHMSVSGQAAQYVQRRVARKLMRAVPWLGSLVALGTLAASIRRKGTVGGTVDTVLDFIPFVSGMKNAAEIVRGRDLIADRPVPPARVPAGLK
jgi:Mg/Co/Ni transporter MgtE